MRHGTIRGYAALAQNSGGELSKSGLRKLELSNGGLRKLELSNSALRKLELRR
jgi:hypothetical protein